jgi:4-hydroxy-2-oxoheptanedioate aldolase
MTPRDEIPVNRFKLALQSGRQQIGLWCTLSNPYGLELLAGSGFDWLLLDTEHSPSDVLGVLAQLQAMAPYPVSPVVRPAWNDPVLIKRYLDIGAQTLLLPYIQNAQEAQAAVRSVLYPPRGVRGVSAQTRATGFGRISNYANRCEAELCLLVQIETIEAMDQLEAIAAVEGVDGVFIGPGDLAASMGLLGQTGHPDVVDVISKALERLKRCAKPSGILTADRRLAERYMQLGTVFTAVGVDAGLLANASSQLNQSYRNPS